MPMHSMLPLAALAACLAGCAMTQRAPDDSGAASASASAGAQSAQAGAPNTLTDAERRQGWRLLFDGASMSGWRGYKQQTVPDGWQVVDGTITRVGRGGDIITTDQFADFELSYDWKLEAGGNSGIMYRVTEDNERSYHSGPEMQVLDDSRHADGKNPLTSAGALYGLYPAKAGTTRPVGEWNTARVVLKGNHVEHWLNGQKIVDAEMWGDDWNARHKASKFVEWPAYARSKSGHIAIQDHGDRVQFRNIKVRKL